MEHTKGKLSLNNYHFPHQYLVIRTGSEDNDAFPDARTICNVTRNAKPLQERNANAERLVKCWNCHDDLLEACKATVSDLECLFGIDGPECECPVCKCAAAIAKAEGK